MGIGKILIADDEPHIRRIIGYNFKRVGYEVIEAADGKEAVDLSLKEAPSLIILDVAMPEMDGYEACLAIKSNEKTKHIPIIMLTARGQEIDEKKGLDVGADVYETKPFSPRMLIKKVEEVLGSEITTRA